MIYFAVIVIALVAFNLFASRRVALYGNDIGQRKGIIIAGIWLIPFIGAAVALDYARPTRCFISDDAMGASEAEPEEPGPIELIHAPHGAVFVIAEHIHRTQDIPQLDWHTFEAWLTANVESQQRVAVIEEARKAWLLQMRELLGPFAYLYEDNCARILSTVEVGAAKTIAAYIDKTRRRLAATLDGIALIPEQEKINVLIMNTHDEYYHYISIFYPDEGEFAFSGGMFINSGCPHFVTMVDDIRALEPVITHEMTHLALSHLNLPMWLDEGIAVNTEQQLTNSTLDHRNSKALRKMHLRFWNRDTIQEFWSGASFGRSDDGNALSYDLARILVAHFARDWQTFARFVSASHRDDAGATAALRLLNQNLGAVAAALLEAPDDEDWSPEPARWGAA